MAGNGHHNFGQASGLTELNLKKQKMIIGEYGSHRQSSHRPSCGVKRPVAAETPSKKATARERAEEGTVKKHKQKQKERRQQRAVGSASSEFEGDVEKAGDQREEGVTDEESRRTSSGSSDANSGSESFSSSPSHLSPLVFKNVPVTQKHFKQHGDELRRHLEKRSEGEIVLVTNASYSDYEKVLPCLQRALSVPAKFIVYDHAKRQIIVTDVPSSVHEIVVGVLIKSFHFSPHYDPAIESTGSIDLYIGEDIKRVPDDSFRHRHRENRPNWPICKENRSGLWCNIVVEVGVSQSFPSLVEAARVYLSPHTQIRAVLLVKIYAPEAEEARPVPMLIAFYQRPMPWPEHPDPNVAFPNPDWVISFGTGALSHQARPFVNAHIIGVGGEVGCPVADGQGLAVECNQEHQLVCTIPADVLYDGVPVGEEFQHHDWIINLFDLQQEILAEV